MLFRVCCRILRCEIAIPEGAGALERRGLVLWSRLLLLCEDDVKLIMTLVCVWSSVLHLSWRVCGVSWMISGGGGIQFRLGGSGGLGSGFHLA